jgi:zinc ribbon protein
MFCAHCGTQVMPGQIFCSKCGQRVASAAPSASATTPALSSSSASQTNVPSTGAGFAGRSRVAQHLSALGILWIVFSAFRLIPGLAMMVFGHMRFPFLLFPVPHPVRMFVMPFIGAIGLLLSGYAIAGVLACWGLMAHRPWARMLAIILGCISLVHFPFGTALGVYTLWVLVPQDAAGEYQRLASTA